MLTIFFNVALNSVLIGDYAEPSGRLTRQLHETKMRTDASILSDEAGPPTIPNFTGAFVGMCCQDLAGTGCTAGFDYFEYREREFSAALLP